MLYGRNEKKYLKACIKLAFIGSPPLTNIYLGRIKYIDKISVLITKSPPIHVDGNIYFLKNIPF